MEAVEIMGGLLKNNSDVQPDIIHGDTQAQSTVVFALSHLLGFKLMPRIRNWKDLTLFRPTKIQNINISIRYSAIPLIGTSLKSIGRIWCKLFCLFIMVRWAHQNYSESWATTVEKSFVSSVSRAGLRDTNFILTGLYFWCWIAWNHYGANE